MCRLVLFLLIIGIVHQANGEVCTWSWTTPSSGNTLTLSVGAPAASVTASVDDTLENDDALTWKLTSGSTTSTLVVETWKSADTDFTESDNAGSYVAAQTVGTSTTNSAYSLTFPAVAALADDGKVISIEHSGCDEGFKTFTGVTLNVKYCTNTYATATTTDTADTSYQGTKEFTCPGDENVKFTATCQADASWSPQYEACPCSSASVREVSILALLVLLCSALTSTHLI